MTSFQPSFSDPEFVAGYVSGPPRFVPGFADLHRMTGVLLAETAPADARILVLGAGGGLELQALASAYPAWTFDGVDPSPQMLELAATTLGPLAARAQLHEGLVFDAPAGPFDGATCLLTLHFLSIEDRLRTLVALRDRMRSGAALVIAHSSFDQREPFRERWLSRYADFARSSGVPHAMVERALAAVTAEPNMIDPATEASLLHQAGFSEVSLFYTAFTWRGWVATA